MPHEERDIWLNMADAKLLAQCRIEAFRAGGPGGQKQNKTSSAVRLVHLPTGVDATAVESRHRSENLSKALKRLRLKIACEIRNPTPVRLPVPETGVSNPQYPLWLAHVLDAMEECGFAVATAAERLGLSTGRLIRLLERDPAVWQRINEAREKRGMKKLRK